MHSALIRSYRRTFRRRAHEWLAVGLIDEAQYDDIIGAVKNPGWKIWRPVLFLIPRAPIATHRIIPVRAASRAAYGPEFRIEDLDASEFEVIEP